MSVIKQMDQTLANMIAAGEVVERPASIIKELVENSIDAKATIINIEVINLGLTEIKVTDNGVGLDEVDAKKAFLRHATSKISHKEDLSRINTLGFRGEALAAILSVSKVTLASRQKDRDGHFVKYIDSNLVDFGAVSLNEGTVITVNDLFYNTPARLKYLKSEFSERNAIINIFDRLALSHPNIRFSLTIDQKLVKETFGNGDYYSLIGQIYGPNILRNIKTFKTSFANIEVSGYLMSPEFSRSSKSDITVFINGRYVKSYAVSDALINGYKSYLMVNRYPMAIIDIKMDPYLVDVNVHPQKLEVKLSNESMLKYQIEQIVNNTLVEQGFKIVENIEIIDKTILKDERYIKESLDFIYNEKDKDEKENAVKIPDMEYVGNLASTYLLFQNEEGLYLVDQHAAEERVNYEHYLNKLDNLTINKVDLLIPFKLDITQNENEFIKANIEAFNNINIYFNEKNEVIAHPDFIFENALNDAVVKAIAILKAGSKLKPKNLLDDLAKMVSCKASIKANHKLSKSEIDNLIIRLRKAKNPYTCPHGRPVITHLTHYQIERMFKRVV